MVQNPEADLDIPQVVLCILVTSLMSDKSQCYQCPDPSRSNRGGNKFPFLWQGSFAVCAFALSKAKYRKQSGRNWVAKASCYFSGLLGTKWRRRLIEGQFAGAHVGDEFVFAGSRFFERSK